MTKAQKPILLAAVLMALAFLTSCGEHNFLGELSDIFLFSSSSYRFSSSSNEPSSSSEGPSNSSEGPSSTSVRVSSTSGARSSSSATGGGYGLALTAFTTSKTIVSQNEVFIVSSGFGNDFMYTPFPGGQVGTALVDSNDNIKAVTGIRNLGALDPRTPTRVSAYGAKEASCVLPGIIASGKYRLRMVALIEGDEEWQIVAFSRNGIPTFIDFENKTSGDNSKRKSFD